MISTICSCVSQIWPFSSAQTSEIDETARKEQEDLKKAEEILKKKERLKDLGFSQDLVDTHPDFVDFLFAGDLIYTISMFQNSTRAGEQNHGILDPQYKVPAIKINDLWVPWDQAKKLIKYDENKEKIVSCTEPEESWNYISPHGLTVCDRFSYDVLYPIEKLSDEEYQELLTHAQKFWEGKEEVDADEEKNCILQVATTNRITSDSWLLEGALKNYPEHITYRLIDHEGNVYSFGFQMTKEQLDAIFNEEFPCTFLKTTISNISTPDYEEPKKCQLKRVTSLTLTKKRIDSIIQFVSEKNKEGIRFNFIRQNCATLGREVLKLAGVQLPVRMKVGECLSLFLPSLERLPYIGFPLSETVKSIKSIVQPIFEKIASYTPGIMKWGISLAQEGLNFCARKVGNIFTGALGVFLGASKMSSALPQDADDDLDNRYRFTSFSRLIRSFEDWFSDDVYTVDHHLNVIRWQESQRTTVIYQDDSKPKMRFL